MLRIIDNGKKLGVSIIDGQVENMTLNQIFRK